MILEVIIVAETKTKLPNAITTKKLSINLINHTLRLEFEFAFSGCIQDI
jgi:hypothetical protein